MARASLTRLRRARNRHGLVQNLTPEQQTLVNNLALGAVAFGGVTTAIGKTMEAAEGVGSAFKTAGELWGGAKKVMGDSSFLTKNRTGFSNIVTKAGSLAKSSPTRSLADGRASPGLSQRIPSALALPPCQPPSLALRGSSRRPRRASRCGLTSRAGFRRSGRRAGFLRWRSLSSGAEFWEQASTGVSDFCTGVGEKKPEQLKQGASDTWENIKTGASNAWNDLKTNVGNLAQGAVDTVSNGWNNLTSNTQTAFSNVGQTVQNDMNTAKTVGSSAAGALQAAMNGDWETAKSQAANAFNAIKDNVGSKLDAAESTAVSIADRIGRAA